MRSGTKTVAEDAEAKLGKTWNWAIEFHEEEMA